MSEKMPHQEVFGLPAEPLIDAVDSADTLALVAGKRVLPYGVHRPTLQTAVDVWPLAEDVQRGRPITPEDVRPHTDDIIDNIVTNPAVTIALERKGDYDAARKLRWFSRFSDLEFVRAQARPEVEEKFPGQVEALLASDNTKHQVEAGLERAKPYVDVLVSYDNPRQQFTTEVDTVAEEIRDHTRQVRDARLAVEYARYPADTFRGKVLRWRHRNKTDDQLIKPHDAAAGIDHVIRKTLQETPESSSTPMLRAIVDRALAETGRTAEAVHLPTSVRKLGVTIPTTQILETAAPEIIQTLEAALPEERRDAVFLKSIKKRFTFKAKLGRFFKSLDLSLLRTSGPRFARSVRDVLPTKAREINRAMDEIRELFLT
jgi:hypothetical protein